MDGNSTDQQPVSDSCISADNQHTEPSPKEPAVDQAPAPPSQIRTGHGETFDAHTYPVPSEQTDVQRPDDISSCVEESDSEISGPAPSSPNITQDIAAEESASHTPSSAPSAQAQSSHKNVSKFITPTHQTTTLSLENPGLTSSVEQLQSQPARPLRLSESLGLEGCGGIFGGFVGILGVFGFLNFLWFGYGSAPEAVEATWVWRQLAIRNWMPQAVTLASIILRLIIGIQATICTSMVAALLLERLSIPRLQVAQASVMRGINDGPWKLVMLVLSHKSNVSYLLRHPESWLIIPLAFVSLALQFTSTILLSDMHSFEMVGDPNVTTFSTVFDFPGDDKFHLYQGSLMLDAPVYPVYGEIPAAHDSSPDNRGFSDTGLTQRGLLPMTNSDIRTSVREYDGMGMVMSSQVVCMRPVITNASLEPAMGTAGNMRQLLGVLHYSQSLQEARPGTGPLCSASEECDQVPFECIIPAAYKEGWAPGGCIIDGVGGRFRGPSQPMWDPVNGPWSENSSIWLVYSTNMTQQNWMSMPANLAMESAQPLGDSEWITYEMVPGSFVNLAVCFSAFDFAYRDTRMKAAEATTEHSTTWSLVLGQDLNINEVQTYLGLNRSQRSVADRGILTLEVDDGTPYTPPPPLDDLIDLPAEEISPGALTASSLQLVMSYQLSNGNTKNTTFLLCPRCTMKAEPVHREYAFLFSNIILGDNTGAGRAADALHAFISVAGINVYDRFLANSMDVAEQVLVVTTRQVTAPGSWPPSAASCAGLIAVAGLLAAYLSLVTATTVLYMRHTRYSRYGNIWHVISQLAASEELEDTLELGNNASDGVVAKGLRTKGMSKEDVWVKLGTADGYDKIKVKRT